MAFHCGAPTRDGSACQRHVRELGTRCPQHRNLGGPALRPPRHAMRVIELADPALTTGQSVWPASPRDRVTPPPNQESPPAETGTLADEEPMFYDAEPEDTAEDEMTGLADPAENRADDETADLADNRADNRADDLADAAAVPTTPVWLQWAAEGRERAVKDGERDRERVEREPGRGVERGLEREPGRGVDREPVAKHDPEAEQAGPGVNGHAVKAEEEPEQRIEQRPLLRKERALDPDWIGGRPLFRDEAPTRPMTRIEFEPSDDALPRRTPVRPPRISAMRSVVLNPQPKAPAEPAPEADPPTLIDRMPPIDPDDLAVPEFLRPDFVPAAPEQKPEPPPPAERPSPTGRTPITDFLRAPGRGRGRPSEQKPEPTPPAGRMWTNHRPRATGHSPTADSTLPPDESLIADRPLTPDESLIAERPLTPDRPPLPVRQRRPHPAAAGTGAPAADGTGAGRPTAGAAGAGADSDAAAGVGVGRGAGRPTAGAAGAGAGAAAGVGPAAGTSRRPTASGAAAGSGAPAARTPKLAPAPAPTPDPDPPTLVDLNPVPPPEDISVPDFIIPGFARPAPEPPLRTVLSTVLGPDLWQRCYTEWGPAHCTALARIARAVDGLAPSANAAMRSTAGAGMRWLGMAREREALADLVAEAISHPSGATAANQARTVRLYGAAICVALNVPLRRCACHRDLERDVSGELIRLGLEELAGEVP